MDTVQSFAYLSERDFPEEQRITLKRTFNSCQRWSITCHTYICTVHALDEFPSLLSGRNSTIVQCCGTKTEERLTVRKQSLAMTASEPQSQGRLRRSSLKECVIHPRRWMRQAGFYPAGERHHVVRIPPAAQAEAQAGCGHVTPCLFNTNPAFRHIQTCTLLNCIRKC